MFNNINLIDIKKEYDKYEAAIEKAAYFDVEKINIVECNPMNSLILYYLFARKNKYNNMKKLGLFDKSDPIFLFKNGLLV